MYLLDTNVISETRRPRPDRGVLNWLTGVPDEELHVSAVTIGELQAGIEITREQDSAKAEELEAWLGKILASYNVKFQNERFDLSADAAVFRVWARLKHRQSNTLMEDALIAATALVHRLTVVTRDTGDFAQLGVETLNPFET